MQATPRSPRRIYTITTALWAVGLAAHAAWFIVSALAGPPSPNLYANHLSFMLAVFVLFRAPFWLIGLLLLLIAEFALLGRRRKTRPLC